MKLECFIWIFPTILFLLCSIGLFLLGYQEVKKYLNEPEVVDITTKFQSDANLPVFTFCPLGKENSKPNPLNFEILEKCGLKYEDIYLGTFLGSTETSECQDPEIFWESVHLKLPELGLRDVLIYYQGGSLEFNIENDPKAWTRQLVTDFNGNSEILTTCYELNFPKNNKTIIDFQFRLEQDTTLKVYVHHKGFLDLLYPSTSIDFASTIVTGEKSHTTVKYFENVVLKDQFGKPCTSNENYNWAKDILEQTEAEIQKEFGCGTPFGSDKTKLCKLQVDHEKYLEVSSRVHLNRSYLRPCKFLSGFDLAEKKAFEDGWHVFTFSAYLQRFESRIAYQIVDLFADLGGYLGIFLGTSLFQLKDLLSYLINKFQ